MIISLENLGVGLRWWLTPEKGKTWTSDFHNEEYHKIYEARGKGPTKEWWTEDENGVVARLGRWRAYRGSIRPNTRKEITKLGIDQLDNIAIQYDRIVAGAKPKEPSISNLGWEDVASLFDLASEIKPSPVFSGKMCHFLFPKLFIVMDNFGTDVSNYEIYWRGMKAAWMQFHAKSEAQDMLINRIKSAKPLHRHYPFETKIIELCHIGHKQRNSSKPF